MMEGKTETPLVPKLRFAEYQNSSEWHVEALEQLATPISEKVGTAVCVPMSITTGVGLVSQIEKFGRNIAGDSYKNYIRLEQDDFAYNKSATKEFPQGYIAHFSGTEDAAVPNSIFTCFRPNQKLIVPEFLDHLFHGNHHGRWLRKFITVGARAHGSLSVNDDDLFAMPIPLPPAESEQQKIAECLGSLDDLIAAESRKLQALRDYKKGLMQQLFPRPERIENGKKVPAETVPRLRFPEFQDAGEWEENACGNLFINRIEKGLSGLPLYSVTMHDGMVRRDTFDRNYYDIKDAAGNKKVSKGDIAYNMMRMWQGALGVAAEDCMVSPAYIILVPQAGVFPDFFAYFLKTASSLQLLTAHSRGLTKDRLRLYYDDFASIRLRVPSEIEQQKIALFLLTVDEHIGAQSLQVETLKDHKRGLLQQLFPALRSHKR